MGRLSKRQYKKHEEALALLEQDTLSWDDKLFVLENYQEGAAHNQSVAGAFFTPTELAEAVIIETDGYFRSSVDLCAGIGMLAFHVYHSRAGHDDKISMTCLELNPEYAAIGKKLLPEATWVVGDVFDYVAEAEKSGQRFDLAISNPPYGQSGLKDGSKGMRFEYAVIEAASRIAAHGIFIIPQSSTPFRYSGQNKFEYVNDNEDYEKFRAQTGIAISMNCGIDTSFADKLWHGTRQRVEIALTDFTKLASVEDEEEGTSNNSEPQLSLFAEAA